MHDVADRFWSKVDKTEGCWLWTAGLFPAGYGLFHPTAQTSMVAHRWAFIALVGPIPDGLDLDHLCRVRRCVNPDHLEPVTRKVNVLRGAGHAAVNAQKITCLRGHPLNEANTYTYDASGLHRRCRECHNQRQREYTARRRAAAKKV